MFRTSFVIAAIGLCPSVSKAQDQPLTGVWSIAFPAGFKIQDGVMTVTTRTGTLTVRVQADSLVATLATAEAEGQPPRPDVRLAANAGAGDAVFVQRSKAQLNINGAMQEATAITTWSLRAKGDQLEGEVDRKIEGADAPSPGPQPVTGTRIKG